MDAKNSGTELSRIYEGYADDPQSVVDCLEMMEPDMKDVRKQLKSGAVSWQVYKPAEDTNVILIHISAKNCTYLYYIQPKDQME